MAEKEYIEREAAIEAAFSATSLGNSAFRDVYDTVNRLRLIPAADVRPVRKGKWREMWKRADSTDYGCTACGGLILDVPNDEEHPLVSYCPNCGADMREKQT